MALFDEDNHGKNLTNATIWLESANDSSDYDGSNGSGCSFRAVICVLGAIVALCGGLLTCVANSM
ncbi:MAG: hypothetical protein IJI68_05695 [Eggerthellaceae bacterium]|nr:hypothetical protein [Eggerthellaceae bacterium]